MHTFSFIKEGYDTVEKSIFPTQPLYTINMGGDVESDIPDYAEGVVIRITPQGDFLTSNLNYRFSYYIDSSVLSLSEFGFELLYDNGTSIYSDSGITSSGGNLSTSFNVTNLTRISMSYYYITNSTRINGTTDWLIYETNDFSIFNFFERFSSYTSANMFGVLGDDNGYFSKALLSILILIGVTGSIRLRYGLGSEAAVTGLLFGIIFMLNIFDMIPSPDFLTLVSLGDFLLFLIAIITISYIIKEEGR